jgi:hypothetical protein
VHWATHRGGGGGHIDGGHVGGREELTGGLFTLIIPASGLEMGKAGPEGLTNVPFSCRACATNIESIGKLEWKLNWLGAPIGTGRLVIEFKSSGCGTWT